MKVYPSLENYLDAAADYCEVSVNDMIGTGRARKVCRARWLYYLAARSTQRFSLHEIAKGLSRESHTVVTEAVSLSRNQYPELLTEADAVAASADRMVKRPPKHIDKSVPIGADQTHLIRKINSLASRVTALEEQLAASGVEVG